MRGFEPHLPHKMSKLSMAPGRTSAWGDRKLHIVDNLSSKHTVSNMDILWVHHYNREMDPRFPPEWLEKRCTCHAGRSAMGVAPSLETRQG